MESGVHVLCRSINGGPAAHQFIVLVPQQAETLSGIAQAVSGVRCVVMGAYNVSGFLRASLFADSDADAFKSIVSRGSGGGIQADKLEIQACLAVPEDQFLSYIYKTYLRYKSFEGTKEEIEYPDGNSFFSIIFNQLNPWNYNSNSWAQSLVVWSGMKFFPGKVMRDFRGLDVGNDRLIPAKYFG